MNKKEYQFSFDEYNSLEDLPSEDASLLNDARTLTETAYAPYSNFKVGAVAKLANGKIVSGTNQENASYPVGLCAERALMAAAGTLYPGVAIDTMAISYQNQSNDGHYPISPCGMCRQFLQEFEERTKHPIRLVMAGLEGKVYVIEKASQLLPLAFTGKELKK